VSTLLSLLARNRPVIRPGHGWYERNTSRKERAVGKRELRKVTVLLMGLGAAGVAIGWMSEEMTHIARTEANLQR
jgi:hypothetical protein